MAPFLIWTMQRTGGTALMDLLAAFSGYPRWFHEPFNGPREGAWVRRAMEQALAAGTDWAAGEGKAAMAAFLSDRAPIKHCYHVFAPPLHSVLLTQSREAGYRHLVLDRRDDVARILSRMLARTTGVWFPAQAAAGYPAYLTGAKVLEPFCIEDARLLLYKAHRRRMWLAEEMKRAGVSPLVVFHEEIFGRGLAGEARLRDLAGDLDLPFAGSSAFVDAADRMLASSGQGSAAVLERVPNIAEMRESLLAEASALVNPWEPQRDGDVAMEA